MRPAQRNPEDAQGYGEKRMGPVVILLESALGNEWLITYSNAENDRCSIPTVGCRISTR